MALYAFDGTSNEDHIDDTMDTNVVRFTEAYQGERCYRSGVGTRMGTVGRIFGGWMGLGLHARVSEALDDLKENFAKGDTTIDIVGFSRGTALHFANQVAWKKVGEDRDGAPAVRFLGLFDVVASTGPVPGHFDFDLDKKLPAHVRKCCHAMALDEGRSAFHVVRIEPEDGVVPGTLEELWFRGCHSDIGGGKDRDGLANIALSWMFARAIVTGVPLDPAHVTRAADGRKHESRIVRVGLDKGLNRRDIEPGDRVHASVRPRESINDLWHNNPKDGCVVVNDAGAECGRYPAQVPWP